MTGAGGRKSTFSPAGPLLGTAAVPGDKSISHRALILAALAVGRSRIEGLNGGADVGATIAALRAMGAKIDLEPGGGCDVAGVGTGGLLQPDGPLDMGNSGTSARLLAGVVASHPITAVFTGDASLSRRPMERVAAPLRRLGAHVETAAGGTLPLAVTGITPALPRSHRLEVASAQVKSALLLAALNTPGLTEVIEPVPTRDHLERLLRLFGADIEIDGPRIRLRGEAELTPQRLFVPGDFSAAAFFVVAALIVPGSSVRVEGVSVNPRRTGLLRALQRMGADITLHNPREVSGEPVADLTVRASSLTGLDVPLELAPDMIDEFPALFVAAAFARGATRTSGLAELRLKESDRLAAMAAGLAAIGASVEEHEDGLTVHGSGGRPLAGGATIAARGDHRIAMSFAVAGLHSREPIEVDDMAPVETSFPGFEQTLARLTL